MKQTTNKESLHIAAGANDLDTVRKLLKDGADIDAIDRRGLKAPHVAISYGHIDVLRLMVNEFNLNVNECKKFDFLSRFERGFINHMFPYTMEHESDSEYYSLSSAPNEMCDGINLLHQSAWLGQMDVMRVLLGEFEADVNLPGTDKKMTALQIAIEHRNPNIACALIEEFNADLNHQDITGFTALHHAIVKQNLYLVTLLLENGADPTLADKGGISAYIAAELRGPAEIRSALAIYKRDQTANAKAKSKSQPSNHTKSPKDNVGYHYLILPILLICGAALFYYTTLSIALAVTLPTILIGGLYTYKNGYFSKLSQKPDNHKSPGISSGNEECLDDFSPMFSRANVPMFLPQHKYQTILHPYRRHEERDTTEDPFFSSLRNKPSK